MFLNILETLTCEPLCTNDNYCSGKTCKCGTGPACTGDQICKTGKCGMNIYPHTILKMYTNVKL